MARSNNPDNYPPYYGPALLSVANTGKTVRIPTDNAHRLKQRVYAFVNAVDKQEIALQVPYESRTARIMRQVSLTSEPGCMVMSSKNHGPEADAFRAAIAGFDPEAYATAPPARTPEQEAALEAAMRGDEPPTPSTTDEDEDGIPDLRSLLSPTK